MAANATTPPPPTASQIDALIKVGLIVVYLLPEPYHSLPMTEVISAIVSPNSTTLPTVNMTTLMLPVFGPEFNITATLGALDMFLKYGVETTSERSNLLVSTWILTVAMITAMAVRLYARAGITRELRAYDWVAVLAMVLALGLGFMTIYQVHMYGEGKHLYYVSLNDFKRGTISIVIGGYLYHFSVNTIKVSLLLFYLHLSPHRKFRWACFGTLTLVAIGIILGIFFISLACRPFDFWNHPFEAKCLPRVILFDLSGVLQIVTDVIIWTLPVPVVWNLPLKLREKLVIVGTFGIGGIVCVASFLRIFKISEFVSAADATYSTADAIIWSVAEVDLAIIVSCVPAIKSFVIRYAPALLGSQRPSENSTMVNANDLEFKPKPSAWKNLFWSRDKSIGDSLFSEKTATTASTATRPRTDVEMEAGVRGSWIIAQQNDDITEDERRRSNVPGDVSPNYKSIDESSKEGSRVGSSRGE